jgi:hypothetical protein
MSHKSIENYLYFQSKKVDKILTRLYSAFFIQISFQGNACYEIQSFKI